MLTGVPLPICDRDDEDVGTVADVAEIAATAEAALASTGSCSLSRDSSDACSCRRRLASTTKAPRLMSGAAAITLGASCARDALSEE